MNTKHILIMVTVIALIAFFFPKECATTAGFTLVREEGDTHDARSKDCTCIGFKSKRPESGFGGLGIRHIDCAGIPLEKTCYHTNYTLVGGNITTGEIIEDKQEIPC